MGFGSYDESEQQQQDVDADEDEAITVHEHEHDGEMTLESDKSTDDLIGQLQEIKENKESEED